MLRRLSALSISCVLTACVTYPLDWYDPCHGYECSSEQDDRYSYYEPDNQYSNVTYVYTVNEYRFDNYVNCRDVIGSSRLPRYRYNNLISDCMRGRGYPGSYRWMNDDDLRNKAEYRRYRERHDKDRHDNNRPDKPAGNQVKPKPIPSNQARPFIVHSQETRTIRSNVNPNKAQPQILPLPITEQRQRQQIEQQQRAIEQHQRPQAEQQQRQRIEVQQRQVIEQRQRQQVEQQPRVSNNASGHKWSNSHANALKYSSDK